MRYTMWKEGVDAPVAAFDADSMDDAIDEACAVIGTGSCDIDCPADWLTYIVDENDGCTTFQLVEEGHDRQPWPEVIQ